MSDPIKVGILVVSDSCASGDSVDQSGPNIRSVLENYNTGNVSFNALVYRIVPDDVDLIKNSLIEWSDNLMLDLILTSGGTGLGVRDFTPEATKQVLDKEINNLSLTILVESLKITRFACLSRAVSGVRKKTLIINLPGSKKGSQESLEIVLPVLKHAIDLINDVKREIKQDHVKIQSPHSSLHCHHHEHHHKDFSHNETNESRVTESDINSRARESIYPMMTMSDVMSIVMEEASNLEEVEELHYMEALDRICAENILAREPLPPYAASIKDGFALKLTKEQRDFIAASGTEESVPEMLFKFDVIGSANAGDSAHKIQLEEGQCAKINTGGPVPLNADAVIQIEDTIALEKTERGEDAKILIVGGSGGCGGGGGDKSSKRRINLKLGQDIRPVGFDIKEGECVVAKGTLMQAPQCGICATVGSLRVKCFKLPKVALISTGNELQSPDKEHLESGQIRDSNKSLLKAALKSNGIETIVDAGIASDDVNSVLGVFRKAMENADIVISTGGVSMGDRDLVRDVLIKDFGAKIHFAQMKMKPGKPTTFGTCVLNGRKKLLFCLPGNPVSAIVTFNLIVVPCLRKLKGYVDPFHTQLLVKCEFEAELDPRPEYHRCYLKWPTSPSTGNEPYYALAYSTGNQHSSRLMSMSQANCLVLLPARSKEKTRVERGEIHSALIIDKI